MKQRIESTIFPIENISNLLKENVGNRNRHRNDIAGLKKQFTKNMLEIKKFLEIMKNKDNKDIDMDTLFNSRNLLLTLSNENHIKLNEKESDKKCKTEMKQQKRRIKSFLSYKPSFKSNQRKKSVLPANIKEHNNEFVKLDHSTVNTNLETSIRYNFNSESLCKVSYPIKEVCEDKFQEDIFIESINKGNSIGSSFYDKYIHSVEIDKINLIPDINKVEGKIESCQHDTISCETEKINYKNENVYTLKKDHNSFKDNTVLNNTERKNEKIYKDNIIKNLDSIVIKKYEIHNDFPLNPKFYDVLCINCYECIKLEECDKHSEICIIKPFTEFEEAVNIDINININNKIYKLHKGLKNLGENVSNSSFDELNNLYNTLLKITVEVYQNNNVLFNIKKNMEFLNESTASLSNTIDKLYDKSFFSKYVSFYIPLILYAQRISQLVYQKMDLINKGNILSSNVNYNDSLFKEEDLTERSTVIVPIAKEVCVQNSIRRDNNPYQSEKTSLNKIYEITSNVFSKKEIFSNNPSSMNSSVLLDLKSNFDVNVENFNSYKKEEELKKYFYSIGLYLKLKYSDQIKEHITINELYKRAISNNVDVNEWNNYLRVQLNIK